MLSPLLMLHICGAVVGLLSGHLAMIFRKGSGWHGAFGTVFFVSMLTMSGTAAIIASFYRHNSLNVVVGLLTFYLVSTAWRAAKKRAPATDRFDLLAFGWILTVMSLAMTFGVQAANSPNNMKDQVPAPLYFVFGSVALLCAVSDVRLLVRRSQSAAQRLARHLWRMGLALMIATLSFFPGQKRFLPTWLKEFDLIFAPHILLFVAMIYWLIRVRLRKRLPQNHVAVPKVEIVEDGHLHARVA